MKYYILVAALFVAACDSGAKCLKGETDIGEVIEVVDRIEDSCGRGGCYKYHYQYLRIKRQADQTVCSMRFFQTMHKMGDLVRGPL